MNRRKAALESILAEHGDALLTYARALVGDSREAQRLLEDALVMTFERSGRPRDAQAALGAVRGRMQRAALRLPTPTLARPPAEEGPPDPWEDTVSALRRTLTHLSPHDRALVVMRYLDGMSADAIAMIVGGSPAAVRARLGVAAEALGRAAPGSGVTVDDARFGGSVESTGTPAPWSMVEVGAGP